MKKLVLILIMFCFPVYAADDVDKKQEPQKFKGKITITYNEITLEEMAKKEVEIKKEHKGACKVEISMEDTSDDIYVYANQQGIIIQ